MELVIFHLKGILGKVVEIGDALVHCELGSLEAFQLQHGLDSRNMPVIDVKSNFLKNNDE